MTALNFQQQTLVVLIGRTIIVGAIVEQFEDMNRFLRRSVVLAHWGGRRLPDFAAGVGGGASFNPIRGSTNGSDRARTQLRDCPSPGSKLASGSLIERHHADRTLAAL